MESKEDKKNRLFSNLAVAKHINSAVDKKTKGSSSMNEQVVTQHPQIPKTSYPQPTQQQFKKAGKGIDLETSKLPAHIRDSLMKNKPSFDSNTTQTVGGSLLEGKDLSKIKSLMGGSSANPTPSQSTETEPRYLSEEEMIAMGHNIHEQATPSPQPLTIPTPTQQSNGFMSEMGMYGLKSMIKEAVGEILKESNDIVKVDGDSKDKIFIKMDDVIYICKIEGIKEVKK